MTRGVPHPVELRAEAVAAVLAGAALADVARRYGISKGTLGNWLAQNEVGTIGTPDAPDETDLGELIYGLITEHITAISAQLQAASRPEWLRQQSAADLGQLLGAERDTLLRLLAGLRRVDDQRELAQPASAAPSATDHDH